MKLEDFKNSEVLISNSSKLFGGVDCCGTASDNVEVTHVILKPGSDWVETGDWSDEGCC